MTVFQEDYLQRIVSIHFPSGGDILAISVRLTALVPGALPSGFKLGTSHGTFDLFDPGRGVNPITSKLLATKLVWVTQPVFIVDGSFPDVTFQPSVSEDPAGRGTYRGGGAGYDSILSPMSTQYRDARSYPFSPAAVSHHREQTVFINLQKFKPAGAKGGRARFQIFIPPTPTPVELEPGFTLWRMDTDFNFDPSVPPDPADFVFRLNIPTGQDAFILPKLTGPLSHFTFTLKNATKISSTSGSQPATVGYNFTASTYRKQRDFPLDAQNEPLFGPGIATLTGSGDPSGGKTINISVAFPGLALS